MKSLIFSLIACFALAAFVIPAQASTVWYPTDSGQVDVNFITFAPGFAIFDDSDTNFTGLNLILNDPADTILFSQNGNDWNLESTQTGNTLTLTDSFNFMLALEVSTGNWVGNTAFEELAFGMYKVSWDNPEVEITMIDAQPVPLPASVLLLGPGLLGLIGLRRRK